MSYSKNEAAERLFGLLGRQRKIRRHVAEIELLKESNWAKEKRINDLELELMAHDVKPQNHGTEQE